jgi:hypothetical protein
MNDIQLRKFCLVQAVLIIKRLPNRFGSKLIAPMELADLLFKYIKNGEVNDPKGLYF